MHVEVDGSGPPLLLLHGFTGSGRAWDHVRPALAARAQMVIVDLIGHGQSPVPDDPERYTFDWCVRDLLAVLDGLGIERADVLGYSMGGRVALHLAVHAPARVGTLFLESASPGIEDPQARAQRVHADEELAERIETLGVEAFVNEWERQPLLAVGDHVSADELHAQRLKNSPRGLANSLRGMGAGRQAPLWDRLPTLQLPTRLLVGERDSRYVATAERMCTLLPRAELTICPRAGHTVHLDQPAAFVAWATGHGPSTVRHAASAGN
jgi:2-succinyl-6-hydroxy-2,4-cyclohexadiene-1-carboxylate synthase